MACVGVFETEFDYVYHALRRHGIAASDAEDLVQEVFLVLWRRWAEFDTSRPVRPWLGGIAFRVAYNFRQRSGREVPGGIVDAEDEAPSPEDRLDAVSARSLVLRVLAILPEKYRALIVSHDLDGVPMREIADTLRVPLFTAHTRLRAARLAFAKAVRRIQAVTAARADMPAGLWKTPLLPEARGAAPPPTPPERRRRALARVRALALSPDLPDAAPARRPGPGWSAGLALLTVLVAAGGLIASRAPGRHKPAGTIRTAMRDHDGARAPAESRKRSAMDLGRGLVGYWRFEDGAGSTIAHDSSGNGNDCQLRRLNPQTDWTDGPVGGAINFNGTGWLECPQPAAVARLGKAMSISLWIKRTGHKNHVRALVTRQYESGSLDRFHLGFSDDQVVLRSRQGKSTYADFPALRGIWLHVAATRSETGMARIYLDGEEIRHKQTDELELGGGGNAIIIGGGLNGSDQSDVKEHLEGVMDELVIYDRALAPDEVAALAAGAQPPTR
jgi:RNA polymerase sigma factor (sigma-70 family)